MITRPVPGGGKRSEWSRHLWETLFFLPLNVHFRLQLFERLQEEQPEFADKIIAVNSDLTQPELNLSREDRSVLTENVDVVFHCAATIRFNEPLKSVCRISFLLS